MEYYTIKINENVTQRGANCLFFQIEFKRIANNRTSFYRTLSYQRGYIERMLHESPIWYNLEQCSNNGTHLTFEQMNICLKRLELIIQKLKEIYEISENTCL